MDFTFTVLCDIFTVADFIFVQLGPFKAGVSKDLQYSTLPVLPPHPKCVPQAFEVSRTFLTKTFLSC